MGSIEAIVLFLAGQEYGKEATSFEVLEMDDERITVTATFEYRLTPQPPEFEGQVQLPVTEFPDPVEDGPTPDGIDYEELPDLLGVGGDD